jgi:hypothetical protein
VRSTWGGRPDLRAGARWLLLLLGYAVAVVVLTSPATAQRTLESLHFDDRLGTVPVEVDVVRNGYSVVDTGALGSIFVERTGVLGLGVRLRVTGPPSAGGTLASYVDPDFVRANTATLTDPEATGSAYARRLTSRFVDGFALRALLIGAVGGFVLLRILHPALARTSGRRRVLLAGVGAVGLLGVSTGVAAWEHADWTGSREPGRLYPMVEVPGLSFSSSEIREVAEQVRPFVDKNVNRSRERADDYARSAELTMRSGVPAAAARLRPREGERIVVAEGDPQGSLVGTEVREALYEQLREAVGEEALAARTISGDVTSNGTVAEERFVKDEVAASGDLPVVAVKGDHDSEVTVDQLRDAGAEVPDREVVEAGGLRFAGGADPEFKSLFGGQVDNPSGVEPSDRGAQVREVVEQDDADEAVHVLVHQNEAALGYLGLDSMEALRSLPGPEDDYTRPRDDGIPDLPPGSVTYGHWHRTDGPWVVWNTDGGPDAGVTWTLVDQVGTSGGVEEAPTFNRFSTPYSPPLKPIEVRLHYVDDETGLVTGFISIALSLDAELTISRRTDVGVPRSPG